PFSPKKCGIIIPVYNSDTFLKELLNQIKNIQKKSSPYKLSIIIVDDGSNPPIAKQTIPGLPIEWIRHPQNQGKGAALKTGFNYFLNQDIDP
ncbi:glycosyltransferase, partial [Candidatus Saccharibacteria bacterium]|nr:glycosyltransferase [candidate division Zixibacteria bacterium]NIV71174.1 glycosyltransferase [Calditrichia bacterium]NIV97622.1 glycosyltransferase [Candidatus Saccharibacteria bacterium]